MPEVVDCPVPPHDVRLTPDSGTDQMAITDLYLTTLKDGTTRLDAGVDHAAIDKTMIVDVSVFTVDVPVQVALVRAVHDEGMGSVLIDGGTERDGVTFLETSRMDGLVGYDFDAITIIDAVETKLPVIDGKGAVHVVNGGDPHEDAMPSYDFWDATGSGPGTLWYRLIEPRTLEEHFDRAVENEEMTSIRHERGRYVLDGTDNFETLALAKAAGDRGLRELGPEYGKGAFLADMGLDSEDWAVTFENDGEIYASSEMRDLWILVSDPNTVEIGSGNESRTVTGPAAETVGRFDREEIQVTQPTHGPRP
jgi:hypothetical protein